MDAVEYLRSLEKFGTKPGLERIEALLHLLGEPHKSYKAIHVAGTNGKGSTCAFIFSLLREKGFKVGLFSKPHLQSYRERIRVGPDFISEQELSALTQRMQPLADEIGKIPGLGTPTEFEMGLAVAFQHFKDSGVDYAIIETGMGGTWDATNCIEPVVSVITPVGIDHTERLGTSIEDIAIQKAGIIKKRHPVVSAPQSGEVERILVKRAADMGSEITILGRDWMVDAAASTAEGQIIRLAGAGVEYCDLFVPLLGEHQVINAGLGIVSCIKLAECEGFIITEKEIQQGLKSTRWPGRLEVVQRKPWVILDGANNPHGAQSLGRFLASNPIGWEALHLVVGLSIDKDIAGMLKPLIPSACSITATKARSSRLGAHKPEDIADIASKLNPSIRTDLYSDAMAAVESVLERCKPEDALCICGSLYMVGEVRSRWRGFCE